MTRESDNFLTLINGSIYQWPPETKAVQCTTNTSTFTLLANRMAAPVEILPTTTTVREFYGSQSYYSAREFLSFCEDVLKNSCVTEQGDNIALIKPCLLPGSPASKLTQATVFSGLQQRNCYKAFATNFLAIEGETL